LKLLALLGAVCDGLLEAVSVYPVPLLVMAQPLKLATPLDTVTGPVPPALLQLSTPLPGLVLMVRVTVVALSPVSTLELVSSTATEAEKLPVPVAWMLAFEAGWLVKASCVAVPAVMLKAVLVAPVSPLLDAARVYPVPDLLMD